MLTRDGPGVSYRLWCLQDLAGFLAHSALRSSVSSL
jgi:hypothetical protein